MVHRPIAVESSDQEDGDSGGDASAGALALPILDVILAVVRRFVRSAALFRWRTVATPPPADDMGPTPRRRW